MKKFVRIFSIAALLALGIQSCKKSRFDINSDPNNATDSTVAYNVILPAALNSTASFIAEDWGWLQNYLGYWARSGTYAPNVGEETYTITTSFHTEIWTDIYDNLYDYQAMQISAQKNGADFYSGIARIMKAHNFALLVDVYNNVPYFEALKGSGNTTPKYDKGSDIYMDLFKQLDTAIVLIGGANTSSTGSNKNIAADDIMFGTALFPKHN